MSREQAKRSSEENGKYRVTGHDDLQCCSFEEPTTTGAEENRQIL
jgi:hypothetical protein